MIANAVDRSRCCSGRGLGRPRARGGAGEALHSTKVGLERSSRPTVGLRPEVSIPAGTAWRQREMNMMR